MSTGRNNRADRKEREEEEKAARAVLEEEKIKREKEDAAAAAAATTSTVRNHRANRKAREEEESAARAVLEEERKRREDGAAAAATAAITPTFRQTRGNKKAKEEEKKAARAVMAAEKRRKEKEDAAAEEAASTAEAREAAVGPVTLPVEEVHEGDEEDGLEDMVLATEGGTRDGAGGTDEATEVAPASAPTTYEPHSPRPTVNDHINDINRGGVGVATPMEVEEGNRSPVRSPRRKKSRKDKKKKSSKAKTKRGREDISDDRGEDLSRATTTGPRPSPSILKGKGGTRSATRGDRTAQAISYVSYDHRHKRLVVEASIVLGQEDKYTELTMALRTLFGKFKKKDKTVIFCSVEDGEFDPIEDADQIPLCNTELSNHVMVSGGLRAFQMTKPWGWRKDTTPVNEDGFADPEVHLALSFSCDKDPRKLLDAVSAEWGKLGGNKLFLKEVSAYTTVTPVVIYHLLNTASSATIVAELHPILERAHQEAEVEDIDYPFRDKSIPQLAIRTNVPKVDGLDTSMFKGLPKFEQNKRRCLHLECAEEDASFLQALVAKAKEMNLFKPLWGRSVNLTNASGKDSKPQDITAMTKWVRHHINLHSSFTYAGITGIMGLDTPVEVFSESDPTRVVGEMTLRQVMYNKIKLPDGSSLFGEIHQQNAMMDLEVVVANIPEAERMVALINKQAAVFLSNYLVDQGLPKSFVRRLVKASICPSKLHQMHLCSWDSKSMAISTPDDEEEERLMAIEKASWYKDTFGDILKSAGKREHRDYAAPELLYDIDGEQSVKTIHERSGKGYKGTPGAETLDLGSKTRDRTVIDVDLDVGDSLSQVSNMSREELIALVKQQAKISSDKRGSAPPNADDKSHSSSSAEEDGSSGSDHSSSSSSSSSSSDGSSRDRDAASGG